MKPIELTQANFEQEVLQAKTPVLVDFWASWCGPCRMVSPIVDELAETAEGYKVGKINVDEQPELAQAYSVMSIPTLCVFENGKVARRAVGAQPKNALLRLIQG